MLVKKLVDSLQCIKICCIESEFGRKEHVSSLVRFYFFNSFLDGIILCRTFKRKSSKFVILRPILIAVPVPVPGLGSGLVLQQVFQ